jgi:hypothetical protein
MAMGAVDLFGKMGASVPPPSLIPPPSHRYSLPPRFVRLIGGSQGCCCHRYKRNLHDTGQIPQQPLPSATFFHSYT